MNNNITRKKILAWRECKEVGKMLSTHTYDCKYEYCKRNKNERFLDFAFVCVCERFFAEKSDIMKKCRKSNVCDARNIIMYVCRKFIGLSFFASAGMVNKDHATCMHACDRIENLYWLQENKPKILDERGKKVIECVDFLKSAWKDGIF